MSFNFDRYGDYKTELILYIDEMMKRENVKKEEGTLDRPARMKEIQELTDSYVNTIGERPHHSQLSRLTHLILLEELKDKNPHKKKKMENNFLSASQIMRVQNTETGMEYAEKVCGADGKAYGDGKRRKRSKYENMVVDGDFDHLTKEDKVVTAAG